jgi:hypothetical protein
VQGDPLGPLLFALVLQRPLVAVATAHPAVHSIAYADDTYLIRPGPAVTAAFHTLVQHSAAIRLALSLHSCAVYGTPSTPEYMAAQQSAHILDIQHAAGGLVAAVTPIGTEDYITALIEDCANLAMALIRKLQDLPPPLTAQAKFLLLSRSLQRRLTHFSRVVRPLLALGPLAKLQTAVENKAFAFVNLASDPDTAASMGLHHPLVRMQLRLPLGREVSASMPPVWSLTAALLRSIAHFRCTLLHFSPWRRIATMHFPMHIRLSDPSRSFTLGPPAPTVNPIPPSVLLCGSLSSIAILS